MLSQRLFSFSSFCFFTFNLVLIFGASNGASPNCIKPVNETVFPKCVVTFREEGSYAAINATCLEDNVFVMSPNRTKGPSYIRSADNPYFSTIFDAQMPPYARISCTAPFPMEFNFDGVGAIDFFRSGKSLRNVNSTTNASYTTAFAEVLLTPEATGKYSFYSTQDPEKETSFFLFSERGTKPYLIGGSRIIPGVKLNATAAIIPCIASDLAANVTLFKRTNEYFWLTVNSSTHHPYDRQKGFILNPALPGEYRCFIQDDDSNSTVDFVTVHLNTTTEEQSPTVKPKTLTMTISNGTAVCYSTVNRTDLKFSNAYARNPTEAKILEQCLQRKNPYCGTHSYHKRQEGRQINSRACPNSAPSCLWITQDVSTHPTGIIYCETEEGQESVIQEYVTGFDGKAYTNISDAPPSALLRAKWRPNATALVTGTGYEIYCEKLGYVFSDDSSILSVRYKNASTVKIGDSYWYRTVYLKTEMDALICGTSLWKGGQMLTSQIPISVTEKQCTYGQFKCKSGQCILRQSWQCDGDRDCLDGSDEEGCLNRHCKYGNFRCNNTNCIPNDKKCNNKNDCLDGSDESYALCANTPCTGDDFRCKTGQCAPAHFLCDGDKDCFDGSDENIEHCMKYYPQFASTKTEVTFSPNALNELVCKVNISLPARLKPTIAWWRRGENISDPDRLWQDVSGSKLSLRFENISREDSGEFTCVAINKLQRVVQVFTVTVDLPDTDMTCLPELNALQCLERGCIHRNSVCMNISEEKFLGATSSDNSQIPEASTESTTPTHEAELHSAEESGGSSAGLVIGILLLVVGSVVLAVFGWRYYTRRNVPAGSARLRSDQAVILNGY